MTGSVDRCAFASCGDSFANRYCSAQATRPASERPQSGSAKPRASVILKNATTARMRRYMMAVASVMPACACRRITDPVFACRASTTVVAVDE